MLVLEGEIDLVLAAEGGQKTKPKTATGQNRARTTSERTVQEIH
jgi:hypothetical protein